MQGVDLVSKRLDLDYYHVDSSYKGIRMEGKNCSFFVLCQMTPLEILQISGVDQAEFFLSLQNMNIVFE